MISFPCFQPGGMVSADGPENVVQEQMRLLQVSEAQIKAVQNYCSALSRYQTDFFIPWLKAVTYFMTVESEKLCDSNPWSVLEQYMQLALFNLDIAFRDRLSSIEAMGDYHIPDMSKAFQAWLATLQGNSNSDLATFVATKARVTEALAYDYPQEIKDIADEFGFHFERSGYEKLAETERFRLYKVLPSENGIEVDDTAKPILIVHPYVLGSDILAFLPKENKSYVHCFANHGIPTYVRILKDIGTTPAVQTITLEQDIKDMKHFCEIIRARHKRLLTLNGYCQGGLITLSNLLSGELDGLVDAHITCVAPIDGSRSSGFTSNFLSRLPDRFNDLSYGTKRLPNGNVVADGDLMAWVYKLKSIDDEAPLVAMYRDMSMLRKLDVKGRPVSKTAAAINYWLNDQRHDLPMEITRLSFLSYNRPIDPQGRLPFKAFNRELSLHRLPEKGIPWLICYGEDDRLVEKETALAPQDFIPVEITPFPKGHVAIATSWSLPTSECALHTCFGQEGQRGPVRFHLDMMRQADEKQAAAVETAGRKTPPPRPDGGQAAPQGSSTKTSQKKKAS